MDEMIWAKPMVGALSRIDVLIAVAAVAVLFVLAYFAGRKEGDTNDFFLGGRKVPAIIACLSFVATEVSAVTITANPATGYGENLQYLQFFIGSAASKIFVAFLFIPVFYKHNCTSIYQFLRDRFGPSTQYGGTIFFFITRLLGSGVRLYAACAAIAIILGGATDNRDHSLELTLLAFTVGSIVFIAFGGIKAVVWTGAYETVVFLGAGVAMAAYIFFQIHGGWDAVGEIAGQAGRLNIFNFVGANAAKSGQHGFWAILNDPTSFWAGTANAFFVGLAVFGTDQELVQRLLTVDTRRKSQTALIGTILAALPVTVVYLGLGTLLFVLFKQNPQLAQPDQAKNLLSHTISTILPAGLRGLALAAIILASIDSPLASLSSSFVSDIYRTLIRRAATERHYLWVSRVSIGAFGLVLAMVAWACQPAASVLWLAFQVLAITGGSVLGVFLFGILTRRRAGGGNVLAMIVNSLTMLTLMLLSKYGPCALLHGISRPLAWVGWDVYPSVPLREDPVLGLAWTWLIVLGTFLTFGLAYLFSIIWPAREANPSVPDPA